MAMCVTLVAAIVALLCVAASARRLAFAVAPTRLDPAEITIALKKHSPAEVRQAIQPVQDADWEVALFEALTRPEDARAAAVNEQLTELDYRAQRWQRVPRVCASIATSTGFLLASLALRSALASEDPDIDRAVVGAINVAAVGIAGATFCIAVQFAARKVVKARLEATDRLVERLESLSEPAS
jgi:hypothetical protein